MSRDVLSNFAPSQALVNRGVAQQPRGKMTQTGVLWASDTPKKGVYSEKKIRGAPLMGVCLGLLNGDSTLPQPRTVYRPRWICLR